MRTKAEILRSAKTDLNNSSASFPTSYWLRLREIEVLIDIRDILKDGIDNIESAIHQINLKP